MQRRIESFSRQLATLCWIIAGIALVALLGVTIADVATRYLFRLTDGAIALRVTGSVELVSYLLLCSLLASMAANVEKSQVVVEALTHNLSEAIKSRLHGIYLLGFAALGLVIFIGLLNSAEGAAKHGEVTQDLRLPMSPIYYAAAAMSFLLGLRALIESILSVVFGTHAEVSHGE
ncbi:MULTISPECIES: TRAP transporter small permease subunit [Marinobacter]|uniref:TRAP transporter small permease subunit n=1 Tax=Marinobacter TaxID=2742 RepID=UPI000DADADDD|nr:MULTISPECIES: TRAP transporter small permease subunit [Marinobacter]